MAPKFSLERVTIPILISENHSTLLETARKSKYEKIYLKASCTKCFLNNTIRLKPWCVKRNAVLFDSKGVAVYLEVLVPLSECEECKCRRRVLPYELIPYKTFSLPVIETTCYHYCTFSDGLRNTVNKMSGIRPHYSTLHGWLGGIGERALDRIQLKTDRAEIGKPSLPKVSTLVAETAQKKDTQLVNSFNNLIPNIASFKYKSLFRKELLVSCLRLLTIASSQFKLNAYPLTMWEQFLICIFSVPCFLFSSRAVVSQIQLTDLTDNMILCSQGTKESQRGPP